MRNIYSAKFKVRLTRLHPRYFRCEHGLVTLFLVDEAPENFLRRAELIVQQLHCDIIQAPNLGVFVEAATGPYANIVEQAGRDGFGMIQIYIDRPTDEAAFLATSFDKK